MSRFVLSCAAALVVTLAVAGAGRADSSVSWRKAPEGTFQVNDFLLARGVAENRKPVEPAQGETASIKADGSRSRNHGCP
jgi:hypothetical protein